MSPLLAQDPSTGVVENIECSPGGTSRTCQDAPPSSVAIRRTAQPVRPAGLVQSPTPSATPCWGSRKDTSAARKFAGGATTGPGGVVGIGVFELAGGCGRWLPWSASWVTPYAPPATTTMAAAAS